MAIIEQKGNGAISAEGLSAFVRKGLEALDLNGKKVLCIVPDYTRSMPMPEMFRAIAETAADFSFHIDFLLALGTHMDMSDAQIQDHFGITAEEQTGKYGHIGIFNHDWKNPDALSTLGTLKSDHVRELSEGLVESEVEVKINKRIHDYDHLIVVGPVFPHETVGYSGGNKYFFPGIAGADILNFFHWIGALLTVPGVIGIKHTPVRNVIDAAADLIKVPKSAFCLDVVQNECQGIFFGPVNEAWSAAADAAAESHVVLKEKPFKQVLSLCPPMYDELWVGGKCMYKMECVVEDGGELIIYAPHITDISAMHGENIRKIGYHTRDYFLAQMDRFADIPRGVISHVTNVRGIGTYKDGVEYPRVTVTLATGISKETCEAISLNYRDPDTIDPEAWMNREDEGILVVPNAGETLHRLHEYNPMPGPIV
jgi:nickel-dependent lactate racemase